jgi:hypothetical protein
MKQSNLSKSTSANSASFLYILLIAFIPALTSCTTTTSHESPVGTINVNFGTDTPRCTNEEGTIIAEVVSVRKSPNSTVIGLLVTNKTEGKILKLATVKTYFYDYTTQAGILSAGSGKLPEGLVLIDNFGNSFKLKDIRPKLDEFGNDGDLRPGHSLRVTAIFEGAPLENSKYFDLVLKFLNPYIRERREASFGGLGYKRLRIPYHGVSKETSATNN